VLWEVGGFSSPLTTAGMMVPPRRASEHQHEGRLLRPRGTLSGGPGSPHELRDPQEGGPGRSEQRHALHHRGSSRACATPCTWGSRSGSSAGRCFTAPSSASRSGSLESPTSSSGAASRSITWKAPTETPAGLTERGPGSDLLRPGQALPLNADNGIRAPALSGGAIGAASGRRWRRNPRTGGRTSVGGEVLRRTRRSRGIRVRRRGRRTPGRHSGTGWPSRQSPR
jgi:hypothetical protein